MHLLKRATHAPERLVTGGYFLRSGLEKWNVPEEGAAGLHGFAVQAYPFLSKIPPKQFARLVSASEIGVGAALLAPIVPSALAGVALTAFAGGLVGLYCRMPGMRKPGSIWPTQQGIPLAKDSWLLSIGLGLIVQGMAGRSHRQHGKR